jgi:hypothetical protein
VVDDTRDLSVVVDSYLKFDTQIHQTVVQAFVIATLIHKCFASRDIFTHVRAFKVYVMPMVKYALRAWSLYHTNKIKQTESVRRNFTKRLPGYM